MYYVNNVCIWYHLRSHLVHIILTVLHMWGIRGNHYVAVEKIQLNFSSCLVS